LPKLAGLAGAGEHDEFRRGFNRLMAVVVGIAILGTLGAFVAGPFVGKILFKDFTMSAASLALLAAGSGVFIVALTMAQALVALGDHRITAVAWGIGSIASLVVMAVVTGLELRVDLGFLVGSAVAGLVIMLKKMQNILSGYKYDWETGSSFKANTGEKMLKQLDDNAGLFDSL
jgi:O-antigen/teichoic acid export membrane protein